MFYSYLLLINIFLVILKKSFFQLASAHRLVKAIPVVTRDWGGLKVLSKDRSQEVDIAGAHF